MLPLPDKAKRWLTAAFMLSLGGWALTLPMLHIFMAGQEKWVSLVLTCLFSIALTVLPMLKKRLRVLLYALITALLGMWVYQNSLHNIFAQILDSLISRQPIQPMVTLYADLLIPLAALSFTLYFRLLLQGDPLFSAPILLASALMLWFSSDRQSIAIFLPAMVALPLLFVYSNHLNQSDQLNAPKSRSKSFWQALPLALMIGALAFVLTPAQRQTQPQLEEKAAQLRQLINDYFFFTDSRENFSLSSMGYQPMDEKGLGGTPAISNQPVMEVDTDKKVYLRGSILNLYNGRMWYDTISNERYGYASLRFGALRDTLLDMNLPEKNFRTNALQIGVRMLNNMPSTLFVPQRIRTLNLNDGMVPYLNAASELFITRNLQPDDQYELSYEPYIAGTAETDDLARSLMDADDTRYGTLKAIYTQLPQHLQPDGQVTRLAAQIVGSESDPYRMAMLIRNYLKQNYTYTLDVKPAPEDLDFTSHFLFETRQGYCTYFATAMTVLARTQGLPSRYVEGFVATPGVDGTDAVVTGQQAHAWSEVYIPALGWVTFDATGTTGEMPPPEEEPDDTPPDGEEPKETPQPTPDPEPSPSPEDGNNTPQESPSPQPSPEAQSSPPPREEPFPQAGGQQNKPWLWLLTLIILIALFIWRIRETQPHRQAEKQKDITRKLLIYWQALTMAMAYGNKPMINSETLRDYALRTAPGDAGLYQLSDAVSGILYGQRKADDSALTTARLYFQSAYSSLTPFSRIKLTLARVWQDTLKHIKGAWNFVYGPVQKVMRNLLCKMNKFISAVRKRINKFIKRK